MMLKIILLVLSVAVLVTADHLDHDLSPADHLDLDLSPADEVKKVSQEMSAAMSFTLHPMLSRYRSMLTCQLKAVDEFKKKVADCRRGGKVALCLCIRSYLYDTHTHMMI